MPAFSRFSCCPSLHDLGTALRPLCKVVEVQPKKALRVALFACSCCSRGSLVRPCALLHSCLDGRVTKWFSRPWLLNGLKGQPLLSSFGGFNDECLVSVGGPSHT